MTKTIVIVGFGPGISTGLADRFGAEGFSVALVARNEARLAAGVEALRAKGITAAAFAGDAGDPSAIVDAIARARAELGPVTVIQWNAYGGGDVVDLLAAEAGLTRTLFDVAVVGLLAAVREALPDLQAAGDGAVLITNGVFGDIDPLIDELAITLKMVGVAVSNAAKHKLVGLLAARLRTEGVFVGEVVVAGAVKGTAWAGDGQGIESSAIATAFWDLYRARDEIRARVS